MSVGTVLGIDSKWVGDALLRESGKTFVAGNGGHIDRPSDSGAYTVSLHGSRVGADGRIEYVAITMTPEDALEAAKSLWSMSKHMIKKGAAK